MDIVSNRKFLLGIGIGMVISALLMLAVPPSEMSSADIEKAARDMGMIYKDEVKAMFSTGTDK